MYSIGSFCSALFDSIHLLDLYTLHGFDALVQRRHSKGVQVRMSWVVVQEGDAHFIFCRQTSLKVYYRP